MAIDLSATATRLLRSLAANEASGYLKLVRVTGMTKDPDTGLVTGGTPTTIDLAGALIGYRESEVDGTRIMGGDKKAVVSCEVEPLATDVLRVAGDGDYTIVAIDPVNHAGQGQVYHLQVRSR
jgi:hypothetical protein